MGNFAAYDGALISILPESLHFIKRFEKTKWLLKDDQPILIFAKLFDLESNTRHHIVDFCHNHVVNIVNYIF